MKKSQENQEDKNGQSHKEDDILTKYFHIFLVVAAYWFISISMVFVNKSLLSDKPDLDAPFFVTWYQCVITVAGCYLVYFISLIFPDRIHFPKVSFSLTTCRQVLPLSVVFLAMIGFNNLCLKMIGVSFYYVSRSLSSVFNVILSYLLLKQRTSVNTLFCCGVILFGFYIGVDQESELGDLSWSGVVYGCLASFFVSLYAISIKKVLHCVDNNIWLLTYYNNVNAAVLFVPMIMLNGEWQSIANSVYVPTFRFWVEMTVAGLFGFAIGYVTGLQIKLTSPLSHNISGTAKAAAQTVIATNINHEEKSFLWWSSNILVLLGSLGYARVRQLEMANRAAAAAGGQEDRATDDKSGGPNGRKTAETV